MTKYSVVIPVFNSGEIVGETVDLTVAFFEKRDLNFELILVNDGSTDNSWDIISEKARNNQNISAINLLMNYGQHTANFCGLQNCSGDYVITLDDDLQNDPDEILALIDKVREGNYDLVVGRYRQKKHSLIRRIGSFLVGELNTRVFGKPRDFVLTNFRIIRRDVVDRICSYQTSFPYIPGLAVWFSTQRANVWVEHKERRIGKSNYNFKRILSLVFRILFNYSNYPLRLLGGIGIFVALGSFALGVFYVGKAVLFGTRVPGWTTTVVLISFLNGFSLLITSMLGEYIVQLLKAGSMKEGYHIKETVDFNE